METESGAAKPVVDAVKMPKVKIENSKIAKLNAWCIALSIFFGWATIWTAISGFTKSWRIVLPGPASWLVANSNPASGVLVLGAIAVTAAIVALLTIRKITDAEALKKAWSCVATTFLLITCIYAVNIVIMMIYALMMIGSKYIDQGDLWSMGFVGLLLHGLGAATVWFLARMIANGNNKVLRILSFVAIGIAAVALILAFIQVLVSTYGKKKASIDSLDDVDWSSIFDY